jgi:hypothetical protein
MRELINILLSFLSGYLDVQSLDLSLISPLERFVE